MNQTDTQPAETKKESKVLAECGDFIAERVDELPLGSKWRGPLSHLADRLRAGTQESPETPPR